VKIIKVHIKKTIMINIKIFQVIKYQDKEILILFNKNKELLIH